MEEDSLNVNVLCTAKEEYTHQLQNLLSEIIYEGFKSIYDDAYEATEGKNTLRKFQEILREIPLWNQNIIETECTRIKNNCKWLMNLVTAVFVTNVKILACVRMGGNNKKIKIKIPTMEKFIHNIYIECAKSFYEKIKERKWNEEKNLFNFNNNEPFNIFIERKEEICDLIRDNIDETIRKLVPFENILEEYVANAFKDPDKIVSDVEENENDDDDDEYETDEEEDDEENTDKIIGGEEIADMLPQDAENVRELPQRRPPTPEQEPIDTTGFPINEEKLNNNDFNEDNESSGSNEYRESGEPEEHREHREPEEPRESRESREYNSHYSNNSPKFFQNKEKDREEKRFF